MKIYSLEDLDKLTPEQKQIYKQALQSEIEWLENKPSWIKPLPEITRRNTPVRFETAQADAEQQKFEKFRNQFVKAEGLEGISYEEIAEQMSSGEMKRKKDDKRMKGEL